MAFALHPLMSTYPGASFVPNGNLNGPHLALQSGGPSLGYWAHVPWEVPPPINPMLGGGPGPGPGPGGEGGVGVGFALPPAIVAAQEGRGTGVWGMTMDGAPGFGMGQRFNYGWPKYGPLPLKPELGGFVGKINPYGRSWPHGYYKTTY